ncbi:HalD/BesD family halogenase [Burkholderia gladioli]|uniref:Putative oxygenase n=1 Tax=Burkholderia gladioli (strain BSR3) TaxID=999541 RepID=F2LLT9_BURGS|nr:2OG-Fe(II) oxygenase [Burkholderia gladioli]AEA63785.1 putative oxygenase [Burkholderia gladioli BSR3]MBW5281663.1 2OG-Fe(II) oxygenase [Burkholderia gladioli]
MSTQIDAGLAPRAPAAAPAATAAPDAERAVASVVAQLDTARLRGEFDRQGAFIYLDQFLPKDAHARLAELARELLPELNRNYLPGHKQGGSVSRHKIDEKAPFIAELYRSKALISFLEKLTGDTLQVSPADDPHAYALYYYTKPGDHIGWHYDTSYYDGRRYTLLIGVIDQSSCRLDYELHTRNPAVKDEPGSVQIADGGIVLFDGDKLRHRITPMLENELRVSLTFEYVTDPGMRPWKRFISNMKDAIAYFGFRQVFKQLATRRPHQQK